jgi:hypothetical protein
VPFKTRVTAGVTGGPNVIRHTVRSWLAEAGVPEADVLGRKAEGSATGKRYIAWRAEYPRGVIGGTGRHGPESNRAAVIQVC